MSSTATGVRPPVYRFFDTTVVRTRRLSPGFLRITLTGPDLDAFGVGGADQRIKLVLTRDGAPLGDLLAAAGPQWYATWCAMPEDERPYLRTYTVRAARPELAEIDIDLVLHGLGDGHAGPAARWAAAAVPGDAAVLLGPDRPRPEGADGRAWGVEWAPPADAATLVLAGDETAVPAIAAVLESLAAGPRVVALLEVPEDGDVLELRLPSGVDVRWLPRGDRPRGELLAPALHSELCRLGIARSVPGAAADLEDVDLDTGILWEVPESGGHTGCYAWLAGEAGMVTALRRRLVGDLGFPRTAVAFMGYWRLGSAG